MNKQLPKELLDQLRSKSKKRGELSTFIENKMNGDYNIDDILISYWEATGIVEQRKHVREILVYLVKKDIVERVKAGTYRKPEIIVDFSNNPSVYHGGNFNG